MFYYDFSNLTTREREREKDREREENLKIQCNKQRSLLF